MTVESEKDLQGLLRIGGIVAQAIQHMHAHVEPGMTTKQLDDIGSAFLKSHGARSAPILTYKFPGFTCISLNDEAAHGIPGPRVIKAGDLINIDVSAELEGYFADSGASYPVGEVDEQRLQLVEHTREARTIAIAAAHAGDHIYAVGRAVETFAHHHGYNVIRDLPGHGVGRALHEKPSVPNYFTRRASMRFEEGAVVTIEPFLTLGNGKIYTMPDRWTLRTVDGAPAAQFEHTIVINGDSPIVVTAAA